MPRAVSWQAALLLPQPILTLLYLLAVRAERVPPGFAPVVALGLLPMLSAVIAVVRLRRPEPAAGRGRQRVLLALAALEVSFAVLAAAIVGFAIGLRSL